MKHRILSLATIVASAAALATTGCNDRTSRMAYRDPHSTMCYTTQFNPRTGNNERIVYEQRPSHRNHKHTFYEASPQQPVAAPPQAIVPQAIIIPSEPQPGTVELRYNADPFYRAPADQP
jgi:hypothetical protein